MGEHEDEAFAFSEVFGGHSDEDEYCHGCGRKSPCSHVLALRGAERAAVAKALRNMASVFARDSAPHPARVLNARATVVENGADW